MAYVTSWERRGIEKGIELGRAEERAKTEAQAKRAEQEAKRAEEEARRAEQEAKRAEQAEKELAELKAKLKTLEQEETKMAYVTSWERRGIEKGRAEGRIKPQIQNDPRGSNIESSTAFYPRL